MTPFHLLPKNTAVGKKGETVLFLVPVNKAGLLKTVTSQPSSYAMSCLGACYPTWVR